MHFVKIDFNANQTLIIKTYEMKKTVAVDCLTATLAPLGNKKLPLPFIVPYRRQTIKLAVGTGWSHSNVQSKNHPWSSHQTFLSLPTCIPQQRKVGKLLLVFDRTVSFSFFYFCY